MGGALAAVFDRVGGWVDLFTQVSGQLAADCPGCVPKEPPGGAAEFEVLGVDADGWYGPGTRASHISENEKRGLSLGGIPPVPTTTTTTQPPSDSTETVTTVPVVTLPPIAVVPAFGGMGAELVAQLLGQPCIADGNLSDCPPEVGVLIAGLVG